MTVHLSGWDLAIIIVGVSIINPFLESFVREMLREWVADRRRRLVHHDTTRKT